MRILPIRGWLLLAWLGTAVLGNVLFEVGDRLWRDDELQQPLDTIHAEIIAEGIANGLKWDDPLWQSKLQRRLATWEGAIEIQDAAGRQQFRHGIIPLTIRPDQIIILMEDERLAATIHLFSTAGAGPWNFAQFALPLLLLLLPAILLAWFLGRMVLHPLAAMSQAAQQIANGDLNFYLPPPQVREVAEVFAAFHAMGHALRTSLERQANLEQERRLFISAIAHDLRTPLFALRGYLEGLTTGVAATPEKAAHYLAVCQEQAKLLEQRIANLFAYARLEYLNQAPRRVEIDLCLLVLQTIERFRPHIEAKGIILHLSGLESACILTADKELLTRVFENLLDNAVRLTPHDGTIDVKLQRGAGGVYFTIADSGPGIAPSDLPHLFTPLYRSDISTERSAQRTSGNNTGGAGLGLTIAHQVLQAHGGSLTAANRATGGAEFRAWLPVNEEDI